MTQLSELINLLNIEEEPSYENGRLMSIEQMSQYTQEVDEAFNSLDFHTNHSLNVLGDPFEIVSRYEEAIGVPLASLTTVIAHQTKPTNYHKA